MCLGATGEIKTNSRTHSHTFMTGVLRLRWLCEYKYLCDPRVYLVVEIDANSR